jgi:23S rRNA (cytosine1962-C5)-methyltransferase
VRKRRHPWIYSQAVAAVRAGAEPGAILPVRSADGTLLGWGLHSPESLIAVRMVGFAPHEPPEDWIEQRIRSAHALRRGLGIDSDGVRLVNAEGDFIPGLVADLYGDTAVVSPHISGIDARLERIAACLEETAGARRVYHRRDEHYARVEHLVRESGFLRGQGDGATIIVEGGVRLLVDFERGQKTGFYLDQRENRSIISRCSAGRTVLNLFAYTGAVAIRAAAAGATRVVSVESSRKALDVAQASAALNGKGDWPGFAWVQEDVFSFLGGQASFDIVVADPPPFARRRSELEGALKGYLSLFQECLRVLSPGGLGFFFSCSGAVDRPMFRQLVAEAALRSGRRVRFLRELQADVDHPVSAMHPEGEYLKGWMVHAE